MNLKIGEFELNYVKTKCENSSDYVLFLHGFGGSVVSFEGLQKALSSSINTINIDLIGFGKSSAVPHYFSIYDYAKVVFDGEMFLMYYDGIKSDNTESLGLAISYDFKNWMKYNNNPVVFLSSLPTG